MGGRKRSQGVPRVRRRRNSAWIAFLTMVTLAFLTDWPFTIEIGGMDSAEFWRDHALLSGFVASVLLLGAGVLTLDVPRAERQARAGQRVQDEMHAALAGSLERCFNAFGRWGTAVRVIDDSPSSAASASTTARELQLAVERLIEDLRHWQMVTLALRADLDPRCADLLARQINLAKRARDLVEASAATRALRKRRTLVEQVAGTVCDLGANHELLTLATQEVVDVTLARRILSKSHDLRKVSDGEILRRWGTLRTGLGNLLATGTPGTEVGIQFFHQQFDPRLCEWRELVEARQEAADRLRRGELRLGATTRRSLGVSTPGEGVRHQDIVEIRTD